MMRTPCHSGLRTLLRPTDRQILCASITTVTTPSGTLSVTDATAHYTYGTWRYQQGWKPLHVAKAEGVHFWDTSGKRYLDLSSQLMSCNLGHQNKAVIDAICEQARKLAFISPAFTCDIRAELAVKLLEVMPQGLDKFFFTTSGTEAIEAAIKIAKAYTGKNKILSRYTSYHGSTAGSMAATGDFRRLYAGSMGVLPGVLHGPEANCYRCPFGMKPTDCSMACADYMAYMLDNENDVAAVIVEPIVGTNGVLVPPPGYLPKLARIAKERRVLLIADEVMGGWGRTGEWFSVNHWGVVPDIMATAKGITGAMAPLGLTVTSREVAKFFDDHMFAHGHTYEAHPLTLAPAIAAINEYKRLDLLGAAKRQGSKLGSRLKALMDKHPSIGDVRGIGLFWAVDLTKNRATRERMNTAKDKLARKPLVIDAVAAEMMKRGVFCISWLNHLVIAPPLIIDDESIDLAVTAIDESLFVADAAVTT